MDRHSGGGAARRPSPHRVHPPDGTAAQLPRARRRRVRRPPAARPIYTPSLDEDEHQRSLIRPVPSDASPPRDGQSTPASPAVQRSTFMGWQGSQSPSPEQSRARTSHQQPPPPSAVSDDNAAPAYPWSTQGTVGSVSESEHGFEIPPDAHEDPGRRGGGSTYRGRVPTHEHGVCCQCGHRC